MFLRLSKQFPQKIAVKIAYDNAVAHKIEAGSDMFLMPSKYEPCGLNQIYSLKYGTVPIVRATGGLDDTIEHWDPRTKQRHRLQVHRLQRRSAAADHQGSAESLPRSKFLAATHAQWHEQRFLVECVGQGIRSRLRARTADARGADGSASCDWKRESCSGLTAGGLCLLVLGRDESIGSAPPSRTRSTSIISPGLSFTSRPFCSSRNVVLAARPYHRALPARGSQCLFG